MNIKAGMVVLGGCSAVGLIVLFMLLKIGLLNLLGSYGGIMAVGYLLAAATQYAATGFSEFIRGILIGLNAAMNGLVFFFLFYPNRIEGALGIAILLFAINFLAVFKLVSQFEIYQAILGWCNWLLPMSWPILFIGFLFINVSLLLTVLTGFQVNYFRLRGMKIDLPTGTIFFKGGIASNLNAWNTAFTMGNFAFIDKDSDDWYVKNLSGRTLNLAAFGFVFHIIGAIDGIVFRHENAYAERLAESNSSEEEDSIAMWA